MNCECNDYSNLEAKTGIAHLTTANPNLDGTGTLSSVLVSSGANGTIIKSLIIKATEPTITGMVRLFIVNAGRTVFTLIREIPIPVHPSLSSTPTPAPILPMLEFDLIEPILLNSGFGLSASTQSSQKINIIAEGLDISYPSELPPVCCDFKQTSVVTGNGIVQVANSNLDGSGTIVSIFTSSGQGTIIDSITISALQSTHPGVIRLFISPSGSPSYSLWMEIVIPETGQSSYDASYKVELSENFHLEAGFVIGASTQNAEKFAITIQGTEWTYPV